MVSTALGTSLPQTTVRTVHFLTSTSVLRLGFDHLATSPQHVHRCVIARTWVFDATYTRTPHDADEFHDAYPGAKVIGVPALVAKKAGKLKFDGGKDRWQSCRKKTRILNANFASLWK